MPATTNHILPSVPPLRVSQSPSTPRTAWLDKTQQLLIIVPAKPATSVWGQLPEGKKLKNLCTKRRLSDGILRTRLHNGSGTAVALMTLDGTSKGAHAPAAFDLLCAAGSLAAEALREQPSSLAIQTAGFNDAAEIAVIKAMVLALAAHRFKLPQFKSTGTPAPLLKTVRIIGASAQLDLTRTLAEAEGLNLARWLTSLPPNILDATAYRKGIAKLAKQQGWKMEFLNTKKLRAAGAGAFLAVAQGNATDDAGIVHLRYRPNAGKSGKGSSAKAPLALVGKGIIFDTGGTNLKPFKAMLDMHCDMAGSAVALGTLLSLSQLNFPHPVDCWLAITENRISSKAYKSRDIVTASNGTTIEVIHTDAEGRMALADTLALAGEAAPAAIVDFATLTGSCVAALTDRYSGALTNNETLNSLIIDAGKASGERVWPFPMDADFDKEIHSKVADVLQCAATGGGDHIQAARFLQRFVPKTSNWVHIDLSAATRSGGLAQVPTEITGFGVRYALELIINNFDALTKRGKA